MFKQCHLPRCVALPSLVQSRSVSEAVLVSAVTTNIVESFVPSHKKLRKGASPTRFQCELSRCSHGLRHSVCKLCCLNANDSRSDLADRSQGSAKCLHGENKIKCSVERRCEHQKLRTSCAICTPSSRCIHNVSRYWCRICVPTSECQHGRSKNSCVDCGTGKCLHARWKRHCTICRPRLLCKHKFIRYNYRTCSPKQYCEHGRSKSRCATCGTALCSRHGLAKRRCAGVASARCDRLRRWRAKGTRVPT
jgi:hypothetical protein